MPLQAAEPLMRHGRALLLALDAHQHARDRSHAAERIGGVLEEPGHESRGHRRQHEHQHRRGGKRVACALEHAPSW